jgi:hypothetical protein
MVWLGTLPFLLSPFAAENVLWRSAGHYGVAALLSVVAIALLRRDAGSARRDATAALLLVVAFLTVQSASLAGGVVWVFLAGLTLLTREETPRRRLACEATVLVGAYAGAALLSFAIASWVGRVGRMQPVFDPLGRLALLHDAARVLIRGPDWSYPSWLAVTQRALLAMVPVALLLPLPTRTTPLRRLLAGVTVATAFVTPYAALLPVRETTLSLRLSYLAPLLFAGAWAVVDCAVGRYAGLHVLGLTLISLISLGYGSLVWHCSSGYERVFHCDLDLLRRLEAEARRAGVDRLYVPEPRADWYFPENPHGLSFEWGADRGSAFSQKWSSDGLLEWYSFLRPAVRNPDVIAACDTACRDARTFETRVISQPPTLCLCAH